MSIIDSCIYAARMTLIPRQTWATLTVFVLNMVLNPEVQRKAQKEIDRVVGRDRLPSFGDRASMPYLDHVLLETLRYATTTQRSNKPTPNVVSE